MPVTASRSRGTNYLIPIDAELSASTHVDDEAIPLERILSKVEGAKKLRLVILDACRENPFIAKMASNSSTRSVGRGLARVEPEGGVLVAYSARTARWRRMAMAPTAPSPKPCSII